MTPRLARAMVRLAAASLGDGGSDWGLAMQAELEVAIERGEALSFAAGCLVAAVGRLPCHAEGRWQLARHALALGLLVPGAFLQFACAIGLSSGLSGPYGVLGVAGARNPLLESAQLRAMPALLIPWLLLGIGHLRLAWTLLDRDWTGMAKAGALIAAATLTLATLMALLMLDGAALRLLVSMLAVELSFVVAVFQGDARLPRSVSPQPSR